MTLGLLPTSFLAAGASLAFLPDQPTGSIEAAGEILEVSHSGSGALLVGLAVGEEDELRLRVSPDTRVSVDGESVPASELEDAAGASARTRYRETASGLALEAIDLTWPDEEGR